MSTRLLPAALIAVVGLVSPVLAQSTPATPAGAGPAPAVTAKAEPALKAGMPAPEFKVEKFLKGKEFSGLEKGKVYVVEFWATWCGPCIASMPHLSELQSEYASKGVTICGVNIWEDREYNEGTLDKATKFVEKMGDGMGYTVAYDGASKHMETAWMKAAERNGIPCAFVVDQAGTIAWIGHPMNMDMVLDEVTSGKWDVNEGPARIQAAGEAFRAAGEKYTESVAAGDAAWSEAEKKYPVMAKTSTPQRFGALLSAGHTKEACEIGNRLLDETRAKKSAAGAMNVLGAMGDPATLKTPEAKQLVLKAAQTYFDFSDQKEPGPHITMARAYFLTGDIEKGQAAGKKAVELAPTEVRERMQEWLKQIEAEAKGE